VASSRIEHVYADLDDIARAALAEESSRDAASTVAAFRSLDTLVRRQNPAAKLSEDDILNAHRALLESDPLEGRHTRAYRPLQNWVGGSDFSPRNAVHVPPPPGEVGPLMRDLVRFLNRTDLSPLAQAALGHGQFESIHPLQTATAEARVSAERMSHFPEEWAAAVKARTNSSAAVLLDGLLANPVPNAHIAQQITGSTSPRTYEALDRLNDAGVLRETTGGPTNRVWVVVDVMTEIAELDERIGRRSAPSKRWR
jgi:hypothetical protein